MNAVSQQLEHPPVPPQALLAQMTFGFIISQAISVAAKLRIADHLKDAAKTADELAVLTETHPASLYRLMRALSSVGIFGRDADERFSTQPMGEFLRSDHPESLRGIAHMMCDREHWQAHGNMMQSVKTGENAFEYTFGKPFFPYAIENPHVADIFDDAMTSFTSGIARAVTDAYDFSQAATIADIGGGHGILLSTILEANENAKGILFDQPQVVAGAQVPANAKIVGGDFFAEIPVEADVYLMKHIIHDWNDEQSAAILNNLAKSAKTGAKVLLIEGVVEEGDAPSLSKVMDLNMLVATGGKERTAAEYAELFAQTGFRLVNIHPTASPVQIVEAIRG